MILENASASKGLHPLTYTCPWTPIGDFRSPDYLTLAPPSANPKYTTATVWLVMHVVFFTCSLVLLPHPGSPTHSPCPWLQYSPDHWLSYTQSSITATHCTLVFQRTLNSSPAYPEFSCSCRCCTSQVFWSCLTRFSNLSTGLRYRSASNATFFYHLFLQSSSPHYLRDIITIQPSRSTRSSSLVTLLHPQAQSSLKITNRSFRNAAPHLWNKLPPSLRVPCQSATSDLSSIARLWLCS